MAALMEDFTHFLVPGPNKAKLDTFELKFSNSVQVSTPEPMNCDLERGTQTRGKIGRSLWEHNLS